MNTRLRCAHLAGVFQPDVQAAQQRAAGQVLPATLCPFCDAAPNRHERRARAALAKKLQRAGSPLAKAINEKGPAA